MLSELESLHVAANMRVPHPNDALGSSGPIETYHQFNHTEDPASEHSHWSLSLHHSSLTGHVSTNWAMDNNRLPMPPTAGNGYFTESVQSLEVSNYPPHNPYLAPDIQYQPVPNMEHAIFENPSRAHRHPLMSAPSSEQEHDTWAEANTRPTTLVISQQNTQSTQYLGRFVEEVHSSTGQPDPQDGITICSDVDEKEAANNDEVDIKRETWRGSKQYNRPADDLLLTNSPSRSSTAVESSGSGTLPRYSTPGSALSRNNSVSEPEYVVVPAALPGPKRRKSRSQFTNERLEETNKTRQRKACVRCRCQRVRVRIH